jgi:hypothetical protein
VSDLPRPSPGVRYEKPFTQQLTTLDSERLLGVLIEYEQETRRVYVHARDTSASNEREAYEEWSRSLDLLKAEAKHRTYAERDFEIPLRPAALRLVK